MKAAFITQPGPPESITYGDRPDPQPGSGQCLVQVEAVAVNPIDTYIRGGIIPMEIPSPFIVGCDLAGTVIETGPGVQKIQKGDRVWGSNQGLLGRQGTFADLCAIDEQWLYPVPDHTSSQQVAALALVGITAHLGLFRDAQIQSGEILFVNGGSGGVGSSVVQMAKAKGAKVITTAGSDEKIKMCRDLGADLAINYKTEDVTDAVGNFTPEGVNVWWETLREPDFEKTIPLLARGGRMVLMAGRDARPVFPVGPFYVKDCSLHGFAMFNASPAEQEIAAKGINEMLSKDQLKAQIDRVMPLSESAQAHRLQEDNTIGRKGTLAGKIVLQPNL